MKNDMTNTQNGKRSRHVLPSIFIIYFTLWGLTNLPALKKAWWYSDDYAVIKTKWSDEILIDLSEGRPLQMVWKATIHYIDNEPTKEAENIILRLLQGVFHSLITSLGMLLLSKSQRDWEAFLAMLPFLLWPFNGESVLWRTGANVSISALVSLAGLTLIVKGNQRWMIALGVMMVSLSMLGHQTGALCALCMWIAFILVEIPDSTTSKRTDTLKKSGILLSGYILGGIVSFLLARSFSGDRVAFATSMAEKIQFFFMLNLIFLRGAFYPLWMSVAQVVALVLLVAFVIFLSAKADKSHVYWRLALIGTMFLAPWATLLIVTNNWPAWRVMYLAPLIFTCLFLAVFRLADGANVSYKYIKYISLGLLGILFIGYSKVSWANSQEYVEIFQKDIGVLQRASKIIEEQELSDQVCAITYKDFLRNWNPYRLQYTHADGKYSAFLPPWSAPNFVLIFSDLTVTTDPAIKYKGVELCRAASAEAFQMLIVQPANTLCICP